MAEESLVVLINLVIDHCLLMHQLASYALLESIYYLLENRLVENQFLSTHAGSHVTTGQQFSALEDDAFTSCIKHIYP